MALLSYEDSTPRAHRLKASNAAPPISTKAGTSPTMDIHVAQMKQVRHPRRETLDAKIIVEKQRGDFGAFEHILQIAVDAEEKLVPGGDFANDGLVPWTEIFGA